MYVEHLRELDDGKLKELTRCGEYTRDHIRLDRPDLVLWRKLRRKCAEELPKLEALRAQLEVALEKGFDDKSAENEVKQKIAALASSIARDKRRYSL